MSVIAVAAFIVCSIFGNSDSFAFWEKDLAYEGESIYNYLQVRDTKKSTILSTNVLFGVQSVRMKEGGLTGMYYDYALAAPVMAQVAKKQDASLLVLGMGTGTFAQQTAEYFPNVSVEGVEIDESITDLAHEYFELSEEIPVTTYDGRAYLYADEKQYDVIMVDAYQDITIPFQMSSVEFFQLVKEHLKPGGVMVVNMNMHTDEEGNINEYLSDTIDSVFLDVACADVKGSTNRELFACDDPDVIDAFLDAPAKTDSAQLNLMMEEVRLGMKPYQGGSYIFTDDKAPVELMGMKAIDALIRDELGYYKELYHEKGLKGLIDEI